MANWKSQNPDAGTYWKTGNPADTGGTGAVSVSLAGQSFALLQGTLSASIASVPITRVLVSQAITLLQGALSHSIVGTPVSVALAGQSIALLQGSLSVSSSSLPIFKDLSGQSVAFLQGVFAVNKSVIQTGQSYGFSAGSLGKTRTQLLSGLLASLQQGVFSADTAKRLTGQDTSFSLGTVSAWAEKRVSLTGQVFPYAIGTIGKGITLRLTGLETVYQFGELLISGATLPDYCNSVSHYALGNSLFVHSSMRPKTVIRQGVAWSLKRVTQHETIVKNERAEFVQKRANRFYSRKSTGE